VTSLICPCSPDLASRQLECHSRVTQTLIQCNELTPLKHEVPSIFDIRAVLILRSRNIQHSVSLQCQPQRLTYLHCAERKSRQGRFLQIHGGRVSDLFCVIRNALSDDEMVGEMWLSEGHVVILVGGMLKS